MVAIMIPEEETCSVCGLYHSVCNCGSEPAAEPLISRLYEESTADLIDELKRRSLALLIVQVSVGDDNGDSWASTVKGSVPILAALANHARDVILIEAGCQLKKASNETQP